MLKAWPVCLICVHTLLDNFACSQFWGSAPQILKLHRSVACVGFTRFWQALCTADDNAQPTCLLCVCKFLASVLYLEVVKLDQHAGCFTSFWQMWYMDRWRAFDRSISLASFSACGKFFDLHSVKLFQPDWCWRSCWTALRLDQHVADCLWDLRSWIPKAWPACLLLICLLWQA